LLISNYNTYITTKIFNLIEPFNYLVIHIRRISIGRGIKLTRFIKTCILKLDFEISWANFLNTCSSSLFFFASTIFVINKVHWDDFSDTVDYNKVFTLRNVVKDLWIVVHDWAKEICKAYFVIEKKGFFSASLFQFFEFFFFNFFISPENVQ